MVKADRRPDTGEITKDACWKCKFAPMGPGTCMKKVWLKTVDCETGEPK